MRDQMKFCAAAAFGHHSKILGNIPTEMLFFSLLLIPWLNSDFLQYLAIYQACRLFRFSHVGSIFERLSLNLLCHLNPASFFIAILLYVALSTSKV